MKLERGAAFQATGLGLLLAGAILGLGSLVSLFWVEVLANLTAGIAIGMLYARLAHRRGVAVEVSHLARVVHSAP